MWQQYNTIQYNTIQRNTIQYNTIQYNATQSNTIQYNTIRYDTLHYTALHYTTLHYTTLHYTTLQYNTIQYNTIQYKTIQCRTMRFLWEKQTGRKLHRLWEPWTACPTMFVSHATLETIAPSSPSSSTPFHSHIGNTCIDTSRDVIDASPDHCGKKRKAVLAERL